MNAHVRVCLKAFSGLIAFHSPIAIAAPIHCPESITEQPSVLQTDPAWLVVVTPGQRQLEHVGVFLSIGEGYAAQTPDSTKSTDREERVRWKLPSPGAESYWLGCAYIGTTAKLFIRLNRKTTSCLVTYTLLQTGKRQRLKEINCH